MKKEKIIFIVIFILGIVLGIIIGYSDGYISGINQQLEPIYPEFRTIF